MRHILSILLENEAGALSRVVGLFSARGYNIDSLGVAPTEDSTMSRMTIVTHGSNEIVEQITAKTAFAANAAVIRSAQDMTGELLDILA